MKNNKILGIGISVVILLLAASCGNLNEKNQNLGKTGIKAEIVTQGRQIIPSFILDETFDKALFKITGECKSKNAKLDETLNSYPEFSEKTFYIENGKWDFLLEIIKDNKTVASTTLSTDITINTSVIRFIFDAYTTSSLDYSSGTGAIQIFFNFPELYKITKVTAGIYNDVTDTSVATGIVQEFPKSEFKSDGEKQTITYSAESVPSGAYYVVFKVYQGDTVIAFCPEFVYVANGTVSSGTLAVENLNEIYTIEYVLNGLTFAEGFVAPASYNKMQNITLPSYEDFKQDVYGFCGWYENEDFSDTAITGWANNQKAKDLKLYAKTAIVVRFEMNGYGEQIPALELSSEESVAKPENPSDSTGIMEFIGWYVDANFTKTWNFSNTVIRSMTLYAKWKNIKYDWDYPTTTPKLTWEGNGTSIDPYKITTSQQLADLAYMVNKGTTYENNYFVLDDDIDLNYGIEVTAETTDAREWKPIGDYWMSVITPFKGSFDGKFHTINGLYINSSYAWYVGLFGYIDEATIKNIIMGQGYCYGRDSHIGAIVGYMSRSKLISCGNEATVIESASYAGGLVGKNTSSSYVYNSYNKADVKGSDYAVGICGDSSSSFYNCYNIGSVMGTYKYGIAKEGKFEYCHSLDLPVSNSSYSTLNSCTSITTPDILLEELNAWVEENSIYDKYATWVLGEDGWPTFKKD